MTRGWPRSGVPRAMRDFADFFASARLLARAADVPDYTWFLWSWVSTSLPRSHVGPHYAANLSIRFL